MGNVPPSNVLTLHFRVLLKILLFLSLSSFSVSQQSMASEAVQTLSMHIDIPTEQTSPSPTKTTATQPPSNPIGYMVKSFSTEQTVPAQHQVEITSTNHLADIALVKNQQDQLPNGEILPNNSLIYLSFNTGKMRGKLNADTTLLSLMFIRVNSLLLLPENSKNLLIDKALTDTRFMLLREQYQTLVRTGGNLANLDKATLNLLDQLGEDLSTVLPPEQVTESKRQLSKLIATKQAEIAAANSITNTNIESLAASSLATPTFPILPQTRLFGLGVGGQMSAIQKLSNGDAYTDTLEFSSSLSLNYAIQKQSDFNTQGHWAALLNPQLLEPQSGLIDFSGAKKTDIDLGADGLGSTPQPYVVYSYDPSHPASLPTVMNSIAAVSAVVEVACGLKDIAPKFGKVFKGVFKTAAKMRDGYNAAKDNLLPWLRLSYVSLKGTCLLSEYAKNPNPLCTQYLAKIENVAQVFGRLDTVMTAAEYPEYDNNAVSDAIKRFKSAHKTQSKVSSLYTAISKELVAQAATYTVSKTIDSCLPDGIKTNDKEWSSFALARGVLLNFDTKSLGNGAKDLTFQKYKKLYKGNKNPYKTYLDDGATVLAVNLALKPNCITNNIESLADFGEYMEFVTDFYDKLEKVMTEGSLPDAKLLTAFTGEALDSILPDQDDVTAMVVDFVVSMTPAKIVKVAKGSNTLGGMLYDFVTKPSLLVKTVAKTNNGQLVVNDVASTSLPNMEHMRYLAFPCSTVKNGKCTGTDYSQYVLSTPNIPDKGIAYAKGIWQEEIDKGFWDWGKVYRYSAGLTLGEPSFNNVLLLSGGRFSYENMAIFGEEDKPAVEAFFQNNKNGQVTTNWHVCKHTLATQTALDISLDTPYALSPNTPCTFNNNWFEDKTNNPKFMGGQYYQDYKTSQGNPILNAFLDKTNTRPSSVKAISFTNLYLDNHKGNYVEHKTPGVYTDSTELTLGIDSNNSRASVYNSKVNVFIPPDYKALTPVIQSKSLILKNKISNGGTPLAVRISGLHLTDPAIANLQKHPFYTLLRVQDKNGKRFFLGPYPIQLDKGNGYQADVPIPSKLLVDQGLTLYQVWVYDNIVNTYAERSGELASNIMDRYLTNPRPINTIPFIILNAKALKAKIIDNQSDRDKDGVPDYLDAFPDNTNWSFDTDKDGMPDGWEIDHGLNPLNADNDKGSEAGQSLDADGLSNLDEFRYGTNPQQADTDGDHFNDDVEIRYGSNPNDPNSKPTVLEIPQNVKATPGDAKVTVSWDAVPNTTGYSLCHATESISDITQCTTYANGDWWDPILTTSVELTTLPNGQPLNNGTAYYFRVIAGDTNGNKSSASAEVTAIPTAIVLPSPSLSILFNQTGLDALGATGSGYEFITGNNGRPAVKFNGGSILITNRPEIQFTDGATFDMWVRLDSNVGMSGWGYMVADTGWAMALLAKSHDRIGFAYQLAGQDSNYSGSGFGFSYIGTFDQSWSCGTGATVVNRNPGVKVGEWFRATISISPATGYKTYVNKQLVYDCSTARPDFSYANTQDLYLGKFSDYWYPFNGAMQDLNIYQKALTDAQVQALP